jgi:hypothetical protein
MVKTVMKTILAEVKIISVILSSHGWIFFVDMYIIFKTNMTGKTCLSSHHTYNDCGCILDY